MLAHPDLFANDAKYHQNCLTVYIAKRNIDAAKRKNLSDTHTTAHDKACVELTKEIIFIKKECDMLTLKPIERNSKTMQSMSQGGN